MPNRTFSSVLLLLFLVGSAGCGQQEKAKKINFEGTEHPPQRSYRNNNKNVIKIALGAMVTPREGYVYYKRFIDYIGTKIGCPVELVDREDYNEINNLLRTGDVDIAFVCSNPYIIAHKEFGAEILVAPVVFGETVYYSYIIAHKGSSVKNFADLRGMSFAFTDPMSNSGNLVPTYMLYQLGETPDSYFSKYFFTYAHDKSIRAVAQGIVDGAAVDSLVWEYLNRTDPDLTGKTQIIERSPPFGIPPVVVNANMPPERKQKIQKVFLKAHLDKRGKEILKGMMIEKFILLDDSAYDTVRTMNAFVARRTAKKER